MTGMPEAALARELGLDYACIALVVRNAADPEPKIDQVRVDGKEEWVENLVESIILDAE
jgi:purine nucleoside phosphorylase